MQVGRIRTLTDAEILDLNERKSKYRNKKFINNAFTRELARMRIPGAMFALDERETFRPEEPVVVTCFNDGQDLRFI